MPLPSIRCIHSRKKILNGKSNQISPSPSESMAERQQLRFKFNKVTVRHDRMKDAFLLLKSQIKTDLLEAEQVFASLAIPLMRLVGLKTVEMAEEGRFTSIVFNPISPHGCRRNGGGNLSDQTRLLEEESYAAKAVVAGKELVEKQHLQLLQLIQLLRKIETQVNSHQNDILQTIEDHKVLLHKVFQRAISYISTIRSQNNDTFLTIVKLLQAVFSKVSVVLASVEGGVEDLMQELAEQMCNPMVKYVNGIRAEMKNGICARLLAVVEEMEKAMTNGRLELEEAKKKASVAEEQKIQAFSRLRETEERVRIMEEYLGFISEARRSSTEPCVPHKLLGRQEDKANDDKLLWDLLEKKRKHETPESPIGTKGLQIINPANKIARVRPYVNHIPVTRSRLKGQSSRTPCLDSWARRLQ